MHGRILHEEDIKNILQCTVFLNIFIYGEGQTYNFFN